MYQLLDQTNHSAGKITKSCLSPMNMYSNFIIDIIETQFFVFVVQNERQLHVLQN